VDTQAGSSVPGVFPFDGSTLMLSPSLPWVLLGGVSQVQRYYETLRFPFTHTRRLMDSPPGSSLALDSLGQEGEPLPAAWLLDLRSGALGPTRTGNKGFSQSLPPRRRGFLGCPSCAYALLSDPGRTSAPHQRGASVWPPYPIRRRLQRANNLGAPSHGVSTRCLRFAAASLRTTQDSLAAGGESLPRGS